MPESIFNRLPIRYSYNEDYYQQTQYQGIPKNGYKNIFINLTKNKNITIKFNESFNLNYKIKPRYLTIYTGPLDSLLDYKFGKLEWRSLDLKKKLKKMRDFQGTSVINYPDLKDKFTRIHEPKHLHPERKPFKSDQTLIIKEYSKKMTKNLIIQLMMSEIELKHRKYKLEVSKIKKFEFGGRLADYAYYDMDMTISAALKKFDQIKEKIK